MEKLLTLFLFLVTSSLIAQKDVFWDHFEQDDLSPYWTFDQETYMGEVKNDQLYIQYNRTLTSKKWEPFFLKLPAIDLEKSPFLSLNISADFDLTLGLKVINTKGSELYKTFEIQGKQVFDKVFLSLNEVIQTPVKEIYFYINGGQEIIESGQVIIDELKVGTLPSLEMQTDLLNKAISQANTLLSCTDVQQFPLQAFKQLSFTIHETEQFQKLININTNPQEIKQRAFQLYDACTEFEGKVLFPLASTLTDKKLVRSGHLLYANLAQLKKKGFLYGMQDATGYGVGWKNDDDRSDVKDVCGSYPALFSWELTDLNTPARKERLSYKITRAHELGGVNTLVWHFSAPGGNSYFANQNPNPKNITTSILPGGKSHSFFKQQLEEIATFAKSLKDHSGQSIPLLFRPFHEHNGNWFWWGRKYTTKSDFIKLWRFTVTYLRDELNVHNLLYVYSPDGQEINYFRPYDYAYPGDDFVDILGVDFYFGRGNKREINRFVRHLEKITDLAESKNKIAAVCEVGDRKDWDKDDCLEIEDWFTRALLLPIKNNPKARRITYLANWRNASVNHHFAPYPGHHSVSDFQLFFKDPITIFLNDLDQGLALEYWEKDKDEELLTWDLQYNPKGETRTIFP